MKDIIISDVKKELMSKTEYRFDDLCKIMQVLRSEEGCPWDREQTHKSIRNDIIEETYEVIEAIEKNITENLRSTLGIAPKVRLVNPKSIERSEGKAKRVIDKRKLK